MLVTGRNLGSLLVLPNKIWRRNNLQLTNFSVDLQMDRKQIGKSDFYVIVKVETFSIVVPNFCSRVKI